MLFLDIFPTCMHTERVTTVPFQDHRATPYLRATAGGVARVRSGAVPTWALLARVSVCLCVAMYFIATTLHYTHKYDLSSRARLFFRVVDLDCGSHELSSCRSRCPSGCAGVSEEADAEGVSTTASCSSGS